MAQDRLHDGDVDALLQEEGGGEVACVVLAVVADAELFQHGGPLAPVVAGVDGAAVLVGERERVVVEGLAAGGADQVVAAAAPARAVVAPSRPRGAHARPPLVLPLEVLAEPGHHVAGDRDHRPRGFRLGDVEDQAAALAQRAAAGVPSASGLALVHVRVVPGAVPLAPAGALVPLAAAAGAAAVRRVPVPGAGGSAWHPMEPRPAGARVVAAVIPGAPLQLPPDLHRAGIVVDEGAQQAEGLALAQPEVEADLPPGGGRAVLGVP